jgi:hypothetical protein
MLNLERRLARLLRSPVSRRENNDGGEDQRFRDEPPFFTNCRVTAGAGGAGLRQGFGEDTRCVSPARWVVLASRSRFAFGERARTSARRGSVALGRGMKTSDRPVDRRRRRDAVVRDRARAAGQSRLSSVAGKRRRGAGRDRAGKTGAIPASARLAPESRQSRSRDAPSKASPSTSSASRRTWTPLRSCRPERTAAAALAGKAQSSRS